MSRTSTLILLGILTVLVPFSGLPIALRTLLLVVFGASVAGIAFAMRAGDARKEREALEAAAPVVATPPEEPPTSPPEPTGVSPI